MNAAQLLARIAELFHADYAFAIDGLIAGAIVGAICGAVGVITVLRRLALVGDATGHATLPGVAAAFLLTGSKSLPILLIGALVAGILANLAVVWLSSQPRSRPDASIGVVLSVSFGLGVVLLSFVQASPTGAQSGLNAFLFGSAAGVPREQVVVLAILAAAVLVLGLAAARPLVLATFDPVFAQAIGIPVRLVHGVTLVVLSVVVVLAVRTVGVVLVAAMLIIPASSALLVVRRIGPAVVLAGALGAAAGAAGSALSFLFEDLATGPSMVLIAGVFFAFAFAFRGLRDRRPAHNGAPA